MKKEVMFGLGGAFALWYLAFLLPGFGQQMAQGLKVQAEVLYFGWALTPFVVAAACTPTLALARVRSR